MIEVRPDEAMTSAGSRLGAQPIALAAATLAIIVAGAGSVALWRATSGEYPESARATAARQMQARIAQGYEQLVEKTGALETTQQESIDQLQAVQDQLQSVRRFLASQQADAKRLSEQVEGLTGAIDSLRQSFASAPPPEASNSPSVRHPSKPRTATHGHRRRTRS
jgi:uncharacterized protein HemX